MKLGDFSLVDDARERDALRALLEAFNANATDYPRDSTVHAQFAARAAATPGAVAVIDGSERHTYDEVARQANRIAHFLEARGLPREGIVGVMVDGAFDLVTALLGILQAGGAYLPLDAELPGARLGFMLRDAAARVLIGGRRHIRRLNRLQWECPELATLLCPDSRDIHGESEGVGEFMREEIWDYVGREAVDDISGGGWRSSYTGELLSRAVMDEYGENIRAKLAPLLTPRSRILEVGCASGISMFRLAPLAAYYHGTDLSAEILRWSQREIERRKLSNIRLQHLPAHEIGTISERSFDCVVINSVLQCFSGHNYLRGVLRQAIDLMGDAGTVFLGNVWDRELQGQFEQELAEFQRRNSADGVRTKADRSEDLFIAREFWEDLRAEWPEIASVEFSPMLGHAQSELSRFGYDVVLRVDKGASPGTLPRLRRKRQCDARSLGDNPAGALAERSGPRGLAYVIYTSGSTGQPKGVLIEHRGILRLVCDTNYIELGPKDRILMTGALSFDASTFEIWGALLNGGALCRPPERGVLDAAVMKRLIREHGITTLWLTSSLCNQLADADVTLFSGLRQLLAGGERLSALHISRIRAAHPGLTVINGYGPTENTTFTTCHRIERDYPQDIPIGRPVANTQVWILDSKLQPVPLGAVGELCTGGDGLARGYLNDEALTRERFVRSPFGPAGDGNCRLYRTGDQAWWREDGVVEYVGRLDRQVKIRGFRIELGEIESRLRQYESVTDTAVLARDPGDGSLALVAYVVTDAPVNGDALREHIGSVLPEYMVPAHFVRLEELPLTPNGKVDRAALPAPVAPGASGAAKAPPADEVERQLVAIWEEVLGHEGIGATDNFFASGGHSLRITRLAALIRERLKVEVPLTALFKAATVRAQARDLIAAARFGVAGVDEVLVPLNPGAEGGRVFMFPPGTGDALGYLQLAELLRPRACYGFNFIDSERLLGIYADHIMEVDPEGPYVLFGYSAGGNLAYHTAAELEARGRRVAAVVMVDSGQVRLPLRFPEGEWERVADAFLGHESIRPYVGTAVLREKARRLVASYYEHMERSLDLVKVSANIHNLVCADSGEHVDAEGRLFVSRAGWSEVTRGTYEEIGAEGDHHHMLVQPALAANARRIGALCARIFSTIVTSP